MDEHVTLTNRSSFGCTPHHVLCATSTCPETLTSPGGDARGRVREKRASDRFVTDLYTCHVYLATASPAPPPRSVWPYTDRGAPAHNACCEANPRSSFKQSGTGASESMLRPALVSRPWPLEPALGLCCLRPARPVRPIGHRAGAAAYDRRRSALMPDALLGSQMPPGWTEGVTDKLQ